MKHPLLLIVFGLLTAPALWAGELDHCLGSALSGNFKGSYKTIEMGIEPESGQPYSEIDQAANVRHLSDAEREEARLTIRDGKLYNSKDKRVNHSDEDIYTMDSAGNFYEIKNSERPLHHHSTVFAGQPVAGAGMIIIRNGIIQQISNNSGHYAPPPAILKQTLESLYRQNVDLSQAIVEVKQRINGVESLFTEDAEKYLFKHKGAASCIKETLRNPEKAKESGFRTLSKVDPKGTTALIQNIEKNGDLDRYAPELAKFLKNNPEFKTALSDAGQAKLKNVRVPASEQSKCKTSVFKALRALLVFH